MATSDFDHRVTYANTVKHWTLYTLDAWEAKDANSRDDGATAEDLYEFAAGDDSIVFTGFMEVSSTLSELARKTTPRVVERYTEATSFDGPDTLFHYRLTERGRKVLLDLGIPEELPNRQEEDFDRQLDVMPAHEPGWWQEDYEHLTEEWKETGPEDWITTEEDNVFYRSEGDQFDRGELALVQKFNDHFPDWNFVITMGPYRTHDMAYVVRDPFERVIQVDVYSAGLTPAGMENRGTDHWKRLIEEFIRDLNDAIRGFEE